MTHNAPNILRVDASARFQTSYSRKLSDTVIAQFPKAKIIRRDLAAEAIPQITEDWVDANFTPASDRNSGQQAILRQSDELVEELEWADLLIISVPIYNFGVPASLKAWVDQVARAGRTFRYTAEGPEGLLKDKKAILLVASGGTEVDSAIDFATPYLRHVLGFLGITDVEVISADRLMPEPDRFEVALDKATNLNASSKKAA